jgi:hypothetical protein
VEQQPAFEQGGVGKVCPKKGGEIVTIRWSALKVSEAMNEVELQLTCAQPFIDRALEIVQQARQIPNLAGYMDDRLARVEWDIKEKFGRLKVGIESVRKAIPDGAIEAERSRATQQQLSL